MLVFCLLSVPAYAEEAAAQATGNEQEKLEWNGRGERPEGLPNGERGDRPDGLNGGDFMRGPGGPGGGAGNMAASEPDEELQTILDEVQDAYQLLTFTDPETGFEMQYELFVPDGYSKDVQYPMIMFIPDSRAAGREPEFSLTIGWGGVIWATKEEQAKHPCFVLIPIFTETVVDDNFNTSDQIDTAVRLIESLTQTYSIDWPAVYNRPIDGRHDLFSSECQVSGFVCSLTVCRKPME